MTASKRIAWSGEKWIASPKQPQLGSSMPFAFTVTSAKRNAPNIAPAPIAAQRSRRPRISAQPIKSSTHGRKAAAVGTISLDMTS